MKSMFRNAALAAITFLTLVLGFCSYAQAADSVVRLQRAEYRQAVERYEERHQVFQCNSDKACREFFFRIEAVEELHTALSNNFSEGYRAQLGELALFGRGLRLVGRIPLGKIDADKTSYFDLLYSPAGETMVEQLTMPQERAALALVSHETQRVFSFKRERAEQTMELAVKGDLQQRFERQAEADKVSLESFAPMTPQQRREERVARRNQRDADKKMQKWMVAELKKLPPQATEAASTPVPTPTAVAPDYSAQIAQLEELKRQVETARDEARRLLEQAQAERKLAQAASLSANTDKIVAQRALSSIRAERLEAEAARDRALEYKNAAESAWAATGLAQAGAEAAQKATEEDLTEVRRLAEQVKTDRTATEQARDDARGYREATARNRVLIQKAADRTEEAASKAITYIVIIDLVFLVLTLIGVCTLISLGVQAMKRIRSEVQGMAASVKTDVAEIAKKKNGQREFALNNLPPLDPSASNGNGTHLPFAVSSDTHNNQAGAPHATRGSRISNPGSGGDGVP